MTSGCPHCEISTSWSTYSSWPVSMPTWPGFGLRFVPVSAHRARHGDRGQLMDWLDYYSHDKLLFRFTRPPDPSPTG